MHFERWGRQVRCQSGHKVWMCIFVYVNVGRWGLLCVKLHVCMHVFTCFFYLSSDLETGPHHAAAWWGRHATAAHSCISKFTSEALAMQMTLINSPHRNYSSCAPIHVLSNSYFHNIDIDTGYFLFPCSLLPHFSSLHPPTFPAPTWASFSPVTKCGAQLADHNGKR
jgi:hypothetical protein